MAPLKLLSASPFVHSKTLFLPSHPSNQFRNNSIVAKVSASLIESPVLWVGKLCFQYALIKAGLAGSESNPLISSEFDETSGALP